MSDADRRGRPMNGTPPSPALDWVVDTITQPVGQILLGLLLSKDTVRIILDIK